MRAQTEKTTFSGKDDCTLKIVKIKSLFNFHFKVFFGQYFLWDSKNSCRESPHSHGGKTLYWVSVLWEEKISFCKVFIFSQSVSLTQYVVLSVRHPVHLFQLAYCLNDQAHFAWLTLGVPRGQLRGRRRHLMEDDLRWKTTFDGGRPSTEDDLWRKTIFDGRRPLTEDAA